ncbi:MAG: hypothetical protein ACXAD7_27175 [Candidatus Kariarchaeaceae archaeon]|jgi:hypothetical protein
MDEDYKLYQIASNGTHPYIRAIAIEKITKLKYLLVLRLNQDKKIQAHVKQRINDMLNA